MQAQTDIYDQLKLDYDRCRKEDKQDSAFVIAKQMNAWALKNESDTSLKYAVSLRYVGNCYYSLMRIDSSIFYFEQSLFASKRIGLKGTTDAYKAGYNLALVHYNNSNLDLSEKVLLETQSLDSLTDLITKESIDIMLLLGRIYFETDRINESIFFNTQALDRIEKTYSKKSMEFVDQEYILASIFYRLNQYSQAVQYYKQAAEILILLKQEKSDLYFSVVQDYALCAQDAGELKLAQSLHNETLSFYPENSKDHADCLNNLASFYTKIGSYLKADSCYNLALNVYKKNFSFSSVDYADCLNNIGLNFLDLGNLKKAGEYLLEAGSIYSNKLGKKSRQYTEWLNNIGLYYIELADFVSAEKHFSEAFLLVHSDTIFSAVIIQNLGSVSQGGGHYKEAEDYFLRAHKLLEQYTGDKSDDYARGCILIGALYFNMNRFKDAQFYYEKSLSFLYNNYGGYSIDYAQALENYANNYLESGDLITSKKLFEEVLTIAEKVVGDGHPYYADVLQSFGLFYAEINDFKKAEELLIKSKDICFLTYGSDHLDFALSLLNLGVFHSRAGNFELGFSYFNQSLSIYSKLLGDNHSEVALVYYNIGNSYYMAGDFSLSEKNYVKAIDILKKTNGLHHSDYARCITALGDLYLRMGNLHSAETNYLRSLELFRELYGTKHPNYANSLVDLAFLYASTNRILEAEANYLLAIEIIESYYGIYHEDYYPIVSNLGLLRLEQGNYEESIILFQKALVVLDSLYTDDYIDRGNVYINLANSFLEMKDFEKSESYYQAANEIYSKSIETSHPDYSLLLNNLAKFYFVSSRFDLARIYFEQSLNSTSFQLRKGFEWLSQSERSNFWNTEQILFDEVMKFSAESDSSSFLAFQSALISKSLLLETSRELDQVITQSGDSALKAQFTEMKQLRRAYNKMQSEGSDKREIMNRYNLQADSLDKILVNKLGEYGASKLKFEITWKDVQSNLSSSEAAIEYARYFDDNDSVNKYMALVVRPGFEYPKLVKLGKEDDIVLANQAKAQDFSALYDLIWESTDSLLSGVKTIYYSPTGELNNISFNALCFEASDSLLVTAGSAQRGEELETASSSTHICNSVLMDKYTMHQLTTTRYLADGTLKKNRTLNYSITLAGGINYDDIPAKVEKTDHEESDQDFALSVNLSNRAKEKREGRSNRGTGKSMKYLEGTREEVIHIASSLNTQWSVQLLSDREASENVLKMQFEKESPGVIHIATHGFAFPDSESKDGQQRFNDERLSYNITEDPMVRCGLMLSGSNMSWTGNQRKMIESTGDDGILTAAEVSNMDLSQTKLVVLSACETGLGKIEGSEGTFGLKRGFKLAGVEQLIVSLWSVPDKETMELMTLFYTDLTKTLNPVISFEKAQKEMRNKYPTEPEKWAGFVLVR